MAEVHSFEGSTNSAAHAPALWEPARREERYVTLDALRGIALFGVLLVNVEYAFRIPLFQKILHFHTDPGTANHFTDLLVAGVFEFKSISLFCLLFGVGVALQVERASRRGIHVSVFLARRFAVLLAFGLCHLLLIWNGDILALYAVCGLLLIPFLRLPVRALILLGALAIIFPYVAPVSMPWPPDNLIQADIGDASRIYRTGGFLEIMRFRWFEAWHLILPLLVDTLPQTLGLMMWGVAAWRSGILRNPERHRILLAGIAACSGAIGASTTVIHLISKSGGAPPLVPEAIVDLGSSVPLSVAYGAGFLLWMTSRRAPAFGRLAAMGRMALTNYLLESIVLGFVFYGYGLGLFGRIGPAIAALIAIALYGVQLMWSRWWLHHFYFGPFEWAWRSLTYGRRPPLERPV